MPDISLHFTENVYNKTTGEFKNAHTYFFSAINTKDSLFAYELKRDSLPLVNSTSTIKHIFLDGYPLSIVPKKLLSGYNNKKSEYYHKPFLIKYELDAIEQKKEYNYDKRIRYTLYIESIDRFKIEKYFTPYFR